MIYNRSVQSLWWFYRWIREKKHIYFTLRGYTDDQLPKRSIKIKKDYFIKHNIKKDKIFELHHIFPIAFAETAEEFQLIDRWENLIYISANAHKCFPKRNNQYTELSEMDDTHVKFTSIINKKDYLIFESKKDVLFSIKNRDIMLKINKELNEIS